MWRKDQKPSTNDAFMALKVVEDPDGIIPDIVRLEDGGEVGDGCPVEFPKGHVVIGSQIFGDHRFLKTVVKQ